jgi:hypothetical protein
MVQMASNWCPTWNSSLQKHFRIVVVVFVGDLLLEPTGFFRERRDEVGFAASHRGDDRVRQLHR